MRRAVPKMVATAVARMRGEQDIVGLVARGLTVGSNLWKERRTYIEADFPWAVTIGSWVTLSHDVRIIAHDSASRRHADYTEIRAVTIGDEVYVGAGSIILPGASIGDRAIIGAGSVVRGDVPADTVAVGVPAKVVGPASEYLARKQADILASHRVERSAYRMTAADHREARAALVRDGRVFVK